MSEHIKHFDKWNQRKKQIDSAKKPSKFYVHEREVWWASVGVNIGTEMDGKNEQFERPVMILRKFGKEQFLGVPLTSREKEGVFYVPVTYGENVGTACISQARVFSVKRLLRKIGRVKKSDFESLNKTLLRLIEKGRI